MSDPDQISPVAERPRFARENSYQQNPFTDSAAASVRTSSHYTQRSGYISGESNRASKRPFITYRLQGEYERPWLKDKRLKRTRLGNYIIWGFVIIGVGISGFLNYNAYSKVPKTPYCLILDEDFQTLNTDIWNHEVQVGGFGTGSFDWTTTDSRNSYVDSEGLHIVPTLTTETTNITPPQILNGYTLNLTKAGGDGSCTGTTNAQCSVHSNNTLGLVIPPVRSARLNTQGKKEIKYGRVEVVAKLPVGDWLWPSIWMMPATSVYGPWPASGEIDLSECRGNDMFYPPGGRDTMSSSIHWGPTPQTDAFWRATRGRELRRTDFSKGYHTFGLEWSETYLYTYLDSRLQQILYWDFNPDTTMWQLGGFTGLTVNDTLLTDPWAEDGRPNTPFDQPFYLILNVAVGSTNGWFPDGIGNKPWADSGDAASEFYKSIDQWLPTWANGTERGMTVKSVKMWQQGVCTS